MKIKLEKVKKKAKFEENIKQREDKEELIKCNEAEE